MAGKFLLKILPRRDQSFTRIKEMLWPTMERIETLQRSGKAITGVPSGFLDLDSLTSGFQTSELVVVAARPSMGKTAFCLNIATQAAVDGFGVAVFSLGTRLYERLTTTGGGPLYLPDGRDPLFVLSARVAWSKGHEFGVEILRLNVRERNRLRYFLRSNLAH